MSQFHIFFRGSAVAFAFASTGAFAATVEPVKMEDIVRIDALGFSCVNEENLEAAFAATGKKDGVIPQSCLPKPCDRLLDTDQLSEFLGRDPTDDKWDDYVARYAEYCVAETGAPWPDDVMFANASDDIMDFWDGLIPPLNSGVGSDFATDIVPGTGVLTPVTVAGNPPVVNRNPPGIVPPTIITPPTIIIPPIRPNPPIDIPNNPDVVPPSPVPLPGSLALLFGALGATWVGRRLTERRASA